MKKKLIYVGFAFSHHLNTFGGYHHIANYANYNRFINCQHFIDKCNITNKSKLKQLWELFIRKLTGFPTIPYYLIKIFWLGFIHRQCVFHIIYGENLFTPLFKLLPKTNKIICTLHQPFSWFDNKQWKKYLKMMDGIILVGNNEIKFFKGITEKNNVIYVPHGVHTDFYKPDNNIQKEKILLTVGNWLRDYKMADKIYKKFLEEHPDWNIVVVTNPSNSQLIHKDERISCFSNISDSELKELYLKSAILFLPLIRFTANNSLLEAAACGCNILIASDFADNSYIPEKYITIVAMEENLILKNLNKMETTMYNMELAKYVEEKYSWGIIGNNISNLLLGFN